MQTYPTQVSTITLVPQLCLDICVWTCTCHLSCAEVTEPAHHNPADIDSSPSSVIHIAADPRGHTRAGPG